MRRGCNYAHGVSVLSFSFSRSLNELLLGNLSETVVVVGNAPHDRPRILVCHQVGNCASFLCTKAPMLRIPNERFREHLRTSNSSLAAASQCFHYVFRKSAED